MAQHQQFRREFGRTRAGVSRSRPQMVKFRSSHRGGQRMPKRSHRGQLKPSTPPRSAHNDLQASNWPSGGKRGETASAGKRQASSSRVYPPRRGSPTFGSFLGRASTAPDPCACQAQAVAKGRTMQTERGGKTPGVRPRATPTMPSAPGVASIPSSCGRHDLEPASGRKGPRPSTCLRRSRSSPRAATAGPRSARAGRRNS